MKKCEDRLELDHRKEFGLQALDYFHSFPENAGQQGEGSLGPSVLKLQKIDELNTDNDAFMN